MRITNCKTNHMTTPLGYQMETPVFSWQVEDAAGSGQVWARIRVSEKPDMSALCYDSGEDKTLDSLAARAVMELKPRTRYYWTVTVCAGESGGRTGSADSADASPDAAEIAVSEINWFETGKRDEAWEAKWITCRKESRLPIFRKEIPVKGELASARLYICGLGLYTAEINGQRVSDEYLTPYCNNYSRWLQYQTYDVTEMLELGGALRVMVGDGWYAGRFGHSSKPGDPGHYGADQRLIAEVRLRYADGTEQCIGTDESWTVIRSNITDSSIYDGETRDDTLPETAPEAVMPVPEAGDAARKEHDGAQESFPRLVERSSVAVRIRERVSPVELLHTPAGELVLDLGQNLVGIFDLRVHEPAGTRIRIQAGEVLQNGCFYRDNLRSALAEYNYISDGTEKVIRPEFTFYGYRFVKIEGIPDLKKEDFTALVLYSETPRAGYLTTGNAKVNRLIRNAEWGQKGNFVDVPTDCPQRDERMGWTGDAQVFAPTAFYLRECYPFYRKFLRDMPTEQQMLGGKVPNVIPSFAEEYRGTATVWGDACCIIPWVLYLYYGDVTILEEQFESMKAWVDYVAAEDGDDHSWGNRFHFGDWLALDHPNLTPAQSLGGTDVAYIADVYLRGSAQLTADAARLLGKNDEAEKYDALADKLTEWITAEYFAPNGRCCVDTQTGLLLALRNHLSPKPESCFKRLIDKLNQNRGRLKTGFVGTPFLCAELTKGGAVDKAYDLLLNEEYPGWLYEVNLGATTIWERWNSMNPDGSVSSTGMNSFNHYAYGSIVEWICGFAAGLRPRLDRPGFRSVDICPMPDARLGKIDFEYRSAAGRYHVFWETPDERTLHLKVEVPFGCEAALKLPCAPEELLSGDASGKTASAGAPVNPILEHVENGVCRLKAGSYEITYQAAEGAFGRKEKR